MGHDSTVLLSFAYNPASATCPFSRSLVSICTLAETASTAPTSYPPTLSPPPPIRKELGLAEIKQPLYPSGLDHNPQNHNSAELSQRMSFIKIQAWEDEPWSGQGLNYSCNQISDPFKSMFKFTGGEEGEGTVPVKSTSSRGR